MALSDSTIAIATQFVALLLSGSGGAWLARAYLRRTGGASIAPAPQLAPSQPATTLAVNELVDRCRAAEESLRALRHSLLTIPEIAQRLFAVSDTRKIPEIALDLLEGLFAPSYAVFYAVRSDELVATAKRGECELPLGHRLRVGEGVVGWTAVRQSLFTPDDAAREARSMRERDLAIALPQAGFTACLPIVSGDQTIAVILVGPSLHSTDVLKELARTVALMVAVADRNVRLLQREQHLAQTDGLTGLLNKRMILERLRERLTPPNRGPVSVFMFDIDYFKRFNDTNGHLAGDELLRRMGDLIREHSRDGEDLGRYGGEEFLLVMNGCNKPAAEAAADRLRSLVEAAPLPFREHQPGGKLTISGGVATWPGDGGDPTSLLKSADDALYEAKRAGRNRVKVFRPADLRDFEDAEGEKDHGA